MVKAIFSLSFFLIPIFASSQNSDTLKIKKHLTVITKTEQARNYQNLESLNFVADYIFKEFEKSADSTYYQTYDIIGIEYKNVVCVFGNDQEKTIVIGAHYDVCGDQEGADDNASGVIGLLELTRLLKGQKLNYRLEIVAYTLEEPPYFRSKNMGSYIHAKSIVDNKIDIYGMVCLEMIGYFDDTKNSQEYPLGLLSWVYGDRGDFIALITKFGKGKFARKFESAFVKHQHLKTEKLTAPSFLQGIDFSDHLNYWELGISAIMITDTAFYRNKNYHEETDKMETLNIPKMSKVIDSVFDAIVSLK